MILYSLSVKEMEKDGGSGGEITFIRIYAIPYLTAQVFLKKVKSIRDKETVCHKQKINSSTQSGSAERMRYLKYALLPLCVFDVQ